MADPTPSNGTPSFADQVMGQDGKAIDLTMAKMMADLYDESYGRERRPDIDGWRALDAAQLEQAGIDPASLKNEDSGFLAQIYGDDKGHYVVAYSGTDEGKDWLTNLRQGLGIQDAQYNQAIALAQEAHVAFGEGNVVLTGHSLGGGLAAAAALVSDTPAVTFNAAGVHGNTIGRFGLDRDAAFKLADEGLIRRYTVDNEILTKLQEDKGPIKGLAPDAPGHRIQTPDPDPQNFWERINPIQGIKHGVQNHYIDSVIKSMELANANGGETGPKTIAPLKKDAESLLMSDPTHPRNGLYKQAVEGLEHLDPKLFASRRELELAAVNIAYDADGKGATTISRVAASDKPAGYFYVDEKSADPATRGFVDRERAQQPIDSRQAEAQLQQMQVERQQSTVRLQENNRRSNEAPSPSLV